MDVECVNTRAKWSNDRRKSDGTGRLHAVGFHRIAPIQFRRRRRARGCARMLSPFQFFFFSPRFWRPVESEIPNTHTYSFFLHLFSLSFSPVALVSLEDTLPIQEDVAVGIVSPRVTFRK